MNIGTAELRLVMRGVKFLQLYCVFDLKRKIKMLKIIYDND